ncbi:signal peptidase I [Bacillus luteolus]|uniref:Signal peptidase I n=1 Tax=Litchfieldia luteola TaxID=682179 RepID=A0ABR9QFA0_9BACI|nr:signal peptidase I [Cytobacillus luteolus]MBE4907172.1 signal peptidase I [Cytobacillus luteolus]MBP1943357.1 signal peptidase [Cytobacillus luteolus]
MRKQLKLTYNLIFYSIFFIIITASIGSQLLNRPIIFSVIQSNSMYPLFERGDMAFVSGVAKNDTISIGDIYIFRSKEGDLRDKGWIFHRVIEGDDSTGYITKGDNNDYTDQSYGGNIPIEREWIVSKAITIGNTPLVLPKIGYITLWLGEWIKKLQTNPMTLPILVIIITFLIAVSELIKKPKKKKKKEKLGSEYLYIFGGLTISVLLAGTMLSTTQIYKLPYEISKKSEGVIMGSDVGIIKLGEPKTIALKEIHHPGAFPLTVTFTSKDPQIKINPRVIRMKKGDRVLPELTVQSSVEGQFASTVHIGYFLPLLPKSLIYQLASINYWFALAIVSLLPGIPIMMYPLFDKKVRRNWAKQIRRSTRRMKKRLPMM